MKIAICRLEDIPPLGARRYRGDDGRTIAIFRTGGDAVFALRDQCPHKGGPLSQGIVFGESVACPLHGWCISLRSGEAAAPDVGSVERFDVEVVDGVVKLDAASGAGDWAPACAGATTSCAGATTSFAGATTSFAGATSSCAGAASSCADAGNPGSQ